MVSSGPGEEDVEDEVEDARDRRMMEEDREDVPAQVTGASRQEYCQELKICWTRRA